MVTVVFSVAVRVVNCGITDNIRNVVNVIINVTIISAMTVRGKKPTPYNNNCKLESSITSQLRPGYLP